VPVERHRLERDRAFASEVYPEIRVYGRFAVEGYSESASPRTRPTSGSPAPNRVQRRRRGVGVAEDSWHLGRSAGRSVPRRLYFLAVRGCARTVRAIRRGADEFFGVWPLPRTAVGLFDVRVAARSRNVASRRAPRCCPRASRADRFSKRGTDADRGRATRQRAHLHRGAEAGADAATTTTRCAPPT